MSALGEKTLEGKDKSLLEKRPSEKLVPQLRDVAELIAKIREKVPDAKIAVTGSIAIGLHDALFPREPQDIDLVVSKHTYKAVAENAEAIGIDVVKNANEGRASYITKDKGLEIDFMFGDKEDKISCIPVEDILSNLTIYNYPDIKANAEIPVPLVRPPILILLGYDAWLGRHKENQHKDGKDLLGLIESTEVTIKELLDNPEVKKYEGISKYSHENLEKGFELMQRAAEISNVIERVHRQREETHKEELEINGDVGKVKTKIGVKRHVPIIHDLAMAIRRRANTTRREVDGINEQGALRAKAAVMQDIRSFKETMRTCEEAERGEKTEK